MSEDGETTNTTEPPPFLKSTKQGISSRFSPFQYRDFRLLWTGAIFSFHGSWVQNVAQGWLIYEITHSENMLAAVSFCSMLPVLLLGPLAGTLVDMVDRRKLLIGTQVVFAFSALLIGTLVHNQMIAIWHILAVATLNGVASTIEMPARQSLISTVVPPNILAAAVPLQAMTFNLARIFGPVLGGFLLGRFGAEANYFVNGFSYLGLISAVLAIQADLRPTVSRHAEPIGDLIREGMLYTWREPRLKVLFLMEVATSVFGLTYIPLIPAFAKDELGLLRGQLSNIYTAVGIGAMTGLLTLIWVSQKPYKGRIVGLSMLAFSAALLGLGFVPNAWVAYPLFTVMGLGAIMQFNTTNTLFQLIAPERLKGRVIAMHVWALSGVGLVSLPAFGVLAEHHGTRTAYIAGGAIMVACALWGWLNRSKLEGVERVPIPGADGRI